MEEIKEAKWEDFSLSDLSDNRVYRQVVLSDLKGRKFQFEGYFLLSVVEGRLHLQAIGSSEPLDDTSFILSDP